MVFHWASFQSPAKHLLSKFQIYTTSSNRNLVGVKKTGIHGLKRIRRGPWWKNDNFWTGPKILKSWSSGGLWILGSKLSSFPILELHFKLELTELFKKIKIFEYIQNLELLYHVSNSSRDGNLISTPEWNRFVSRILPPRNEWSTSVYLGSSCQSRFRNTVLVEMSKIF